jgi:transposase InsO family protein
MAPSLHGSARTTPRVRAELQAAREATRALAARHGLNPKTVAKWRRRTTTADAPMGPRRPRGSVLTEAEEAVVVEFRRRTLLPLDDVLGCLRESIPRLTRSALHRRLVRHGISRLPEVRRTPPSGAASPRRRSATSTSTSASCAWPRASCSCSLAIDRVSKFAHVAFLEANTKLSGAAFLREVVAAFPYRPHTVLTDNGMAFADLPKNRGRHPEIEAIFGGHIFDRVCREHGITHKLTKPYHPWTNGQAERMNRTVKDATVKVFHYPDLGALRAHVLAFVTAYNFAKHLKALRWRTPFQAVCDAWKGDPSAFKIDPRHLIPGPHTLDSSSFEDAKKRLSRLIES